MGFLIWLIVSLLCALLYRIGGKGGFPGAKNVRRIGCPLVFFGYLYTIMPPQGLQWILWLVSFGMSCGAMSTYHDYLAPDGSSENWLCWLVTGLVYGLAAVPLIWCGLNWYAVALRIGVLGWGTMFVSEKLSIDWQEEGARGFLYCATLPLMLL